MNRNTTYFFEKSLALLFYLTHGRRTPSPFKPMNGQDLSWMSASPEMFYATSAEAPKMEFCTGCYNLGPVRDKFTFPSAYISPFEKNNTVHGLANLRSHHKARAALIIIHGHTMNTHALLEWYARPAIRMGMDVYFLTLPYHMQRAPLGTWSGQYSLNSDVTGSAFAFMQGVRDLRSLITWIEQERHAPVVLAGISLGAFTSCMTAVVDDRPKAVISILGGGSLAQILWDGYQMGRSRKQLVAGGVSCEDLERYWALLGPGNWQPKIDRERVLMMAGKYDPTVTPSNTERLWQAWGHPNIHWYPCGHATILHYHHPVRDEIFRFLADRI